MDVTGYRRNVRKYRELLHKIKVVQATSVYCVTVCTHIGKLARDAE